MLLTSALPGWDIKNSRILVRADLNVPLKNGNVVADLKLQSICPTLDLILKKNAKIILCTHIGRPKKKETDLSTYNLIPWFEKKGYSIVYEEDLAIAYEKSFLHQRTILLLENLRFYPGEKSGDLLFATALAQLGDYYINDAFGMIHRRDCSVYKVPTLFDCKHKTIGLLMEKELGQAQKLKNPHHPFMFIIGGKKLSDKLSLIKALLPKTDIICIGPAFVFTFLKALGYQTGSSYVDESMILKCKQLLDYAEKLGTKILLAQDFIASKNADDPFNQPFYITKATTMLAVEFGITIGPDTQEEWINIIQKSKIVFFNGLMGDIDFPETLSGVDAIFKAMQNFSGFSVIAGGDSTAAAQILGTTKNIDYLSTGGGSLIAYLAGEDLPALDVLEANN